VVSSTLHVFCTRVLHNRAHDERTVSTNCALGERVQFCDKKKNIHTQPGRSLRHWCVVVLFVRLRGMCSGATVFVDGTSTSDRERDGKGVKYRGARDVSETEIPRGCCSYKPAGRLSKLWGLRKRSRTISLQSRDARSRWFRCWRFLRGKEEVYAGSSEGGTRAVIDSVAHAEDSRDYCI